MTIFQVIHNISPDAISDFVIIALMIAFYAREFIAFIKKDVGEMMHKIHDEEVYTKKIMYCMIMVFIIAIALDPVIYYSKHLFGVVA